MKWWWIFLNISLEFTEHTHFSTLLFFLVSVFFVVQGREGNCFYDSELNSDWIEEEVRCDRKSTVFSNTFRQTSRLCPDCNEPKWWNSEFWSHALFQRDPDACPFSPILFVFVHFSLKWIVNDKGRHNNTLFSGWFSPVAHLSRGLFFFLSFAFTSWWTAFFEYFDEYIYQPGYSREGYSRLRPDRVAQSRVVERSGRVGPGQGKSM